MSIDMGTPIHVSRIQSESSGRTLRIAHGCLQRGNRALVRGGWFGSGLAFLFHIQFELSPACITSVMTLLSDLPPGLPSPARRGSFSPSTIINTISETPLCTFSLLALSPPESSQICWTFWCPGIVVRPCSHCPFCPSPWASLSRLTQRSPISVTLPPACWIPSPSCPLLPLLCQLQTVRCPCSIQGSLKTDVNSHDSASANSEHPSLAVPSSPLTSF